ncbi:MAG: BamA/TamA family outer membrane protein [Kofleriaceae bacterium]
MRAPCATMLLLLGICAVAQAEEAAPPPAEIDPGAVAEQGEFGPAIMIEDISVIGGGSTRRELILRALPFAIGDVLSAGDPRLRRARFKVLALGFFRDVEMSMRRGSRRGRVIVEILLEERGTVVLNRFWFGSSTIAPWWFGVDLSERNLLGSGISVGGGVVYASHDRVANSDDQWAAELRLGVPAIGGSRWSSFGSLTRLSGSEAYQVAGPSNDTSPEDYRAFRYDRTTARGGASYDVAALARLSVAARAELVDAELPLTPTRTLDDGRVISTDLHLKDGRSRVVSATLSFDRDTRPDLALPTSGSRLTLSAELSGRALGSSYDFVALRARYERWWPLSSAGAIGLRLGGGAILGRAPRFDLLDVTDLNRMLAPRALGLLISLSSPLNLLRTASDKPTLGEAGGAASAEYTYRLFGKSSRRIYGGALFVSAGLWGLSEAAFPKIRDRGIWSSLPIDLFIDAGLRVDTDIGVFEFSLANTLGRVPR